MSKFSVKKPLTVFVAVIAILVLGVVAYFRMTPDLLPNMDFPYVLIMTTYPGASPEKVEQEITKPMEQAMSTLDHIQEVTSVSSENVGMVILEFTEGVNMDTVGVDIQQEISQLSADWSDTVGTPYVLKINPSMLPVEVAAVSMEGMDTVELTEFLDETLMNKLEGVPGVARITTSGEIEQELHVVLDQKLIDKLNDRIAAAINGELDDAAAELNEKKEELEDAQKKVDGAQSQLSAGVNALIEGEKQLNEKKTELTAMREQLQEQLEQAQTGRQQLVLAYNALKELNDQVNNVLAAQQEAHDQGGLLSSCADSAADFGQNHVHAGVDEDGNEAGQRRGEQGAQDHVQALGQLLFQGGNDQADDVAGDEAGQDAVAANCQTGHHCQNRVDTHGQRNGDGCCHAAQAAGGGAQHLEELQCQNVAQDVLMNGFHQEGSDGSVCHAGHCSGALGRLHAEYGKNCQGQKKQANAFENGKHNVNLHVFVCFSSCLLWPDYKHGVSRGFKTFRYFLSKNIFWRICIKQAPLFVAI